MKTKVYTLGWILFFGFSFFCFIPLNTFSKDSVACDSCVSTCPSENPSTVKGSEFLLFAGDLSEESNVKAFQDRARLCSVLDKGMVSKDQLKSFIDGTLETQDKLDWVLLKAMSVFEECSVKQQAGNNKCRLDDDPEVCQRNDFQKCTNNALSGEKYKKYGKPIKEQVNRIAEAFNVRGYSNKVLGEDLGNPPIQSTEHKVKSLCNQSTAASAFSGSSFCQNFDACTKRDISLNHNFYKGVENRLNGIEKENEELFYKELNSRFKDKSMFTVHNFSVTDFYNKESFLKSVESASKKLIKTNNKNLFCAYESYLNFIVEDERDRQANAEKSKAALRSLGIAGGYAGKTLGRVIYSMGSVETPASVKDMIKTITDINQTGQHCLPQGETISTVTTKLYCQVIKDRYKDCDPNKNPNKESKGLDCTVVRGIIGVDTWKDFVDDEGKKYFLDTLNDAGGPRKLDSLGDMPFPINPKDIDEKVVGEESGGFDPYSSPREKSLPNNISSAVSGVRTNMIDGVKSSEVLNASDIKSIGGAVSSFDPMKNYQQGINDLVNAGNILPATQVESLEKNKSKESYTASSASTQAQSIPSDPVKSEVDELKKELDRVKELRAQDALNNQREKSQILEDRIRELESQIKEKGDLSPQANTGSGSNKVEAKENGDASSSKTSDSPSSFSIAPIEPEKKNEVKSVDGSVASGAVQNSSSTSGAKAASSASDVSALQSSGGAVGFMPGVGSSGVTLSAPMRQEVARSLKEEFGVAILRNKFVTYTQVPSPDLIPDEETLIVIVDKNDPKKVIKVLKKVNGKLVEVKGKDKEKSVPVKDSKKKAEEADKRAKERSAQYKKMIEELQKK